jgi:molybdopterin-synthase adenylyltransferase
MGGASPDTLSRYSRQMLLSQIGAEGQARLLRSRVVVIGVGALGTALASGMVRAGVGYVRLVDRDFIEEHNLQRQMLFDEDDIAAALPKAVAAANKLRRVNHQVTVEPVVADVDPSNIEALIADCDLVLDGGDNFEVRMLINDACLKERQRPGRRIPWIYGAAIGMYGMTMPFIPGDGPCFRCMVSDLPAPGSTDTCDTVGVLGTVPQVIAALQVTEALKLLTGNEQDLCRDLRYFDVWRGIVEHITLAKSDAPCPACDEGRYEFLEGHQGTTGVVLCGRDAVQVKPRSAQAPDFESLAMRLVPTGEVVHNPYLLRLRTEGYEITLFKDGRAIIKGTNDAGVARALYARYIGG